MSARRADGGARRTTIPNRVLESQLIGVSPYDPATLTVISASLIAVALAACQIPSRRAMRVDPVVALRND